MYLHIDHPDSKKYDVIDLDTGMQILGVQAADDDKGLYVVRKTDNRDKFEIKKGNIKIVKKENQ